MIIVAWGRLRARQTWRAGKQGVRRVLISLGASGMHVPMLASLANGRSPTFHLEVDDNWHMVAET
jgi:hypothetical protein